MVWFLHVVGQDSLVGADLHGADLHGADLHGADLTRANLTGADLTGADLFGANLTGADLTGADLTGADLTGADLTGANNVPIVAVSLTLITPEGILVGWKKCLGGVIVKLSVPAESRRSNATGRKCRAEFVDVLEVVEATVGVGQYDGKTEYRAGERVTCHEWCEDRWQECAGGIHFFITRAEAEAY